MKHLIHKKKNKKKTFEIYKTQIAQLNKNAKQLNENVKTVKFKENEIM